MSSSSRALVGPERDLMQELADQDAGMKRIAAFLRLHPLETLEQSRIARETGVEESSLRSRVSNCRTKLGMRIETRQMFLTDANGRRHRLKDHYVFVPFQPLGREAGDPITQKPLPGF